MATTKDAHSQCSLMSWVPTSPLVEMIGGATSWGLVPVEPWRSRRHSFFLFILLITFRTPFPTPFLGTNYKLTLIPSKSSPKRYNCSTVGRFWKAFVFALSCPSSYNTAVLFSPLFKVYVCSVNHGFVCSCYLWWVRDLVRCLVLKLCQKIRLCGNL